jgi:hypothetical protein
MRLTSFWFSRKLRFYHLAKAGIRTPLLSDQVRDGEKQSPDHESCHIQTS